MGTKSVSVALMAAVATMALLAPAIAAATPAAATPDPTFTRIVVDARAPVGTLKPLRGVNGAPDLSYSPDAASHEGRPPVIADIYRRAAINLVRTHDSGGAEDIDTTRGPLPRSKSPLPSGGPTDDALLMFPDMSADPDDPASYHFEATDTLVRGIRAIGADVIFRLGRGGGTTMSPPDPELYGRIVTHIVMHFNKGWKNGFQNSVKYWEYWNEPDFSDQWWRGTPEQYFALYRSVSRAVKTVDPSAMVGGPTIALPNNEEPYRDGFLAYVRDNKLPLDFFSWHWYSLAGDPLDFARISRNLQVELDSYGLGKAKQLLDEWNANILVKLKPDAQEAAFLTSARIYMQDAPIYREAFYRADGFWGPDGKTPSKAGQALEAMGMVADAPTRLKLSSSDDQGFAAQAGQAADGTIKILLSNYEAPSTERGPRAGADTFIVPGFLDYRMLPRRSFNYEHNKGYDLTVDGLDPRATYIVDRYRISDDKDLSLLDRTTVKGADVHIASPLAAPAVEVITIRRQH